MAESEPMKLAKHLLPTSSEDLLKILSKQFSGTAKGEAKTYTDEETEKQNFEETGSPDKLDESADSESDLCSPNLEIRFENDFDLIYLDEKTLEEVDDACCSSEQNLDKSWQGKPGTLDQVYVNDCSSYLKEFIDESDVDLKWKKILFPVSDCSIRKPYISDGNNVFQDAKVENQATKVENHAVSLKNAKVQNGGEEKMEIDEMLARDGKRRTSLDPNIVPFAFSSKCESKALVGKGTDLYDESNAFVGKSNDFVGKSSNLVDKSNAFVSKSNAFVGKSNALVDRRNALVTNGNTLVGIQPDDASIALPYQNPLKTSPPEPPDNKYTISPELKNVLHLIAEKNVKQKNEAPLVERQGSSGTDVKLHNRFHPYQISLPNLPELKKKF